MTTSIKHHAPLESVVNLTAILGKIVEAATLDRDSGGYTRLTLQFSDKTTLVALEEGQTGWFSVELEEATHD